MLALPQFGLRARLYIRCSGPQSRTTGNTLEFGVTSFGVGAVTADSYPTQVPDAVGRCYPTSDKQGNKKPALGPVNVLRRTILD